MEWFTDRSTELKLWMKSPRKLVMCMKLCFTQLVPYAGEEMAAVRVEPCSSAVSQDKQEVLEVCTNILLI